MISKYSPQAQGILLALFAMLAFSLNDGIFKYAMEFIPMEIAVAAGYFFAIAFLVVYAACNKIPLLPQKKRNAAMFGGLFVLEQFAFIYALKHLPIAELFVVVLAAPVCVVVMSSLFLKEHLRKQEIFAIIFGFAGAVLVVAAPVLFGGNEAATSTQPTHIAWIAAVLNIFLNSSKIIYLRKYCQTENTFSLSIFASVFVMMFFAAQISPGEFDLPLNTSLPLLIGGIIGGAGCVAYVRAFQMAKAPLISATQYSQILWTSLMGVFIFHEKLSVPGMIGIALILMSGYFLYFRKGAEPASSIAPQKQT